MWCAGGDGNKKRSARIRFLNMPKVLSEAIENGCIVSWVIERHCYYIDLSVLPEGAYLDFSFLGDFIRIGSGKEVNTIEGSALQEGTE